MAAQPSAQALRIPASVATSVVASPRVEGQHLGKTWACGVAHQPLPTVSTTSSESTGGEGLGARLVWHGGGRRGGRGYIKITDLRSQLRNGPLIKHRV